MAFQKVIFAKWNERHSTVCLSIADHPGFPVAHFTSFLVRHCSTVIVAKCPGVDPTLAYRKHNKLLDASTDNTNYSFYFTRQMVL